jgi:PIN domain nuclease of toxin-antitoxin system
VNLLLDTHIFLWLISGDSRLPARHRDAIRDPGNEVYLSVVAVWEAIIKHQLGRLPVPEPPEVYLPRQRELHAIESLALDEPSVARLAALPKLHRDPFDRIMVCQAQEHGLTMISVDPSVCAYPVPTLA